MYLVSLIPREHLSLTLFPLLTSCLHAHYKLVYSPQLRSLTHLSLSRSLPPAKAMAVSASFFVANHYFPPFLKAPRISNSCSTKLVMFFCFFELIPFVFFFLYLLLPSCFWLNEDWFCFSVFLKSICQ